MFYTLTANPAVDMTVAGPTICADKSIYHLYSRRIGKFAIP